MRSFLPDKIDHESIDYITSEIVEKIKPKQENFHRKLPKNLYNLLCFLQFKKENYLPVKTCSRDKSLETIFALNLKRKFRDID